VAILGSTGYIGQLCLDVLANLKDNYSVVAIAAGSNITKLNEQIAALKPKMVSVKYQRLIKSIQAPNNTTQFWGDKGLCEIAQHPDVDVVIIATSGKAGLLPTISALEEKKIVIISNKEALVMAGDLIRQKAIENECNLRPIDIEHNALWQSLTGEAFLKTKNYPCSLVPISEEGAFYRVSDVVSRFILPASGGPFFNLAISDLATATASQFRRDPSWPIISKITVDSATLVNKAMEVIEAHWLFGIPYEKIGVVIHREFAIHGLVEYTDGNIKGKLGMLDMRFPIHYALSFPNRIQVRFSLDRLNLIGTSTFTDVDFQRYPTFKLAVNAGINGGTYPAALCAADEIAAELYLENRIRFQDIPSIIDTVLQRHNSIDQPTIEDVISVDDWARKYALETVKKL